MTMQVLMQLTCSTNFGKSMHWPQVCCIVIIYGNPVLLDSVVVIFLKYLFGLAWILKTCNLYTFSGEGALYGVDINTGGIIDTYASFVWEPSVVKVRHGPQYLKPDLVISSRYKFHGLIGDHRNAQ